MLLRAHVLEGVRSGTVTLAFRRWRRPTVRAGSTLLTPVGQLSIRSVDVVDLDGVTDDDAQRAGYASRDALVNDLRRRDEGAVYRIEFGPLRPDPRIALRETAATDERDIEGLRDRLLRLDARAAEGPWTARTMAILRAHPGVRAGDLCHLMRQEKEPFKRNVRKLKNLGLTESLGTGYRLSPRGEALTRHTGSMKKKHGHDSYVAAAPEQFRTMLRRVRAQLARALPDAEEVMKYDMPGYQIGDTIIAGYAAFSKQCGLYVDPRAIAAHADEIARQTLKATKTGVTFSVRKPISDELVEKLARSSRKEKGL